MSELLYLGYDTMQLIMRNLIVVILFLFVASNTVRSYCSPMLVFSGEAANDGFGISVASAGDVNNDGISDIIIGAAWNDAGGLNAGRAYVFSGSNGDTLFVFTGEAAWNHFGGQFASAGDVNNDGYSDLIVGASSNNITVNDTGRVYVFSGLDGDTLFIFRRESHLDSFGSAVASAGDVNNDGFADIIMGAPFEGGRSVGNGRAYVFSGLNGDTLYVFSGEIAGSDFGLVVASAGDVNIDGYDDFIISAPALLEVNHIAGNVYVFSGLNDDTLHIFNGTLSGNRFGWSVASAGDVNNDGYPDIIVGASAGAGRAYVFSGLNGDTLNVFIGETINDHFGRFLYRDGNVS